MKQGSETVEHQTKRISFENFNKKEKSKEQSSDN